MSLIGERGRYLRRVHKVLRYMNREMIITNVDLERLSWWELSTCNGTQRCSMRRGAMVLASMDEET